MSMIGISPIGANGLGKTVVNGASRRPRPPAKTTARTRASSDAVGLGAIERSMLRHPVDRAPEPFLERDRWRPSTRLANLGSVGHQAVYLARRGTQALRILLDDERPSDEVTDDADQLANRGLSTRTKIENVSQRRVALGESDEASDRVSDEVEVTRGLQRSQPESLSGQGLADHRRDEGPRRLTRAGGVEGADDGRRETEAAPEALNEMIGPDFGCRVRR